MRKCILNGILLCLLLLAGKFAAAQHLVWDIGAMETVIANHQQQYATFTKIKNNEAQIAALQQRIATKMEQVQLIQTKLYNTMKDASMIIKTGKEIIYAKKIAEAIGEYQIKMVNVAKSDPKLLVVAAQTELQLITRTADLMSYIYQVVIMQGDFNLLNNKQRLDMMKYVIDNLRLMRGLAYTVWRQMRAAQRNGILQTIMPGTFTYNQAESRKRLAKQVIEDFKTDRK